MEMLKNSQRLEPDRAELYPRTRFSQADILVLDGTAGAGKLAPPASARISFRLKRVGNAVHKRMLAGKTEC